MERVKLCTEALLDAIKQSEVCRNYEAAKKEVEAQPKMRAMLNDFRKKNYAIQNMHQEDELYSEIEKLEKEYHELRKIPVIWNYLQCELDVCRMMQHINLKLAGAVDLDIGDFADVIEW